MDDFILNRTLNVNEFIVKIYSINNEIIDNDYIDQNIETLNTLKMPNNIVEFLEPINGVSKIEIYDIDNNLLINSSKITF